MPVSIKKFDVDMEVKTNGIEFEVRDSDRQIGDCYVTKTGLTWCIGKTTKANGVKITWDELRQLCATKESLKTALATVKGSK